MTTPDLDLVVLGATGFTGRQAAAYMAQHAPASMTWAIAGRNAEKLAAVRASLGPDQAERELIVVDTLDEAAVDAMAQRTRVLLTTVGPYAAYGSLVLGACARHGTHYVDITGETPWVREMLDQHEDVALNSGARIVPLCGFDSVPSDLGCFMMARWIRQNWDQPTKNVRSVVRMKGGFNGGTIASALGMMERGDVRKLAHPFLLNPVAGRPDGRAPEHQDQRGPSREEWLGGWSAPFFMAPVNTRVVRRSQALFSARGDGYGEDFVYSEGMWSGRGAKGRLSAGGITTGMGLYAVMGGTSAALALAKRFAPEPGTGPSEEEMDNGYFRYDLRATAADGRVVRGQVVGKGDPGNRSTVIMLCEAALCLTLDFDKLPDGAGMLTPAVAFGDVLLERLRAAGMKWEVTGPEQPGAA